MVTARNRQPSTSYSRSTSQRFSLRDPVICFLKVDKTCVDIFGVLPRFLEDLLDSENLVCSATSGAKTVLGILQFWFKCHTAHFYKALDVHFSTEDRERCHGVFFHVSPLVYVGSVPFQKTRPLDSDESAKELLDSWLRAFQVGFPRHLQLSQPSVF